MTVLNQPLQTPRAGIIIACMNQKGGVGKTTTAVNLCGEFARHNLKVLLIDCDAQGNAATSLGISKRDLEYTTYEVIMASHTAQQTIQPTRRANYDIIAASERLSGVQVELVDVEQREHRLAAALEPIRQYYDIIMLDCPPALGFVSINALVAANTICIPLQCEFLALEGLAYHEARKVRESMDDAERRAISEAEAAELAGNDSSQEASADEGVVGE